MDDDDFVRSLFPLDDHEGPAEPISEAALDALVAEALAVAPPGGGASGTLDAPGSEAVPAPSGGASGAFVGVGMVVLLLLGVGGYAMLRAPAAPAASGIEPASAAPEETPPPSAAASQPLRRPDESEEATAAASATSAGDAGVDLADPVAPAPRPTTSDPGDLLREANRLRGARAFREAERTYLRAARLGAGTGVAYVARVAAAGLRLERLGDPRGAERLYRSALRSSPGGSLSPEIRRGLALAARRRGAREAERRALRDYLAHHGGSAFAGRAEARLSELDQAEP